MLTIVKPSTGVEKRILEKVGLPLTLNSILLTLSVGEVGDVTFTTVSFPQLSANSKKGNTNSFLIVSLQ